MMEESYENDFWYINYNKNKGTYCAELYSEGECYKFPITAKDLKDSHLKVGMTYFDVEDSIIEEDAIKDSIKINVDSALSDLERENRKK